MLAQDSTSISGSAGWVGTGLLGSVLAWLLFVHLPSKDKQLKDMIDSKDTQFKSMVDGMMAMVQQKDGQINTLVTTFSAERDKDREIRHEALNKYQDALNKVQLNCLQEREQIRIAEDTRLQLLQKAFDARDDKMTIALEKQTLVFVEAMERVRETILADLSIRRHSNCAGDNQDESKQPQSEVKAQ
jgi:hypothetical protein